MMSNNLKFGSNLNLTGWWDYGDEPKTSSKKDDSDVVTSDARKNIYIKVKIKPNATISKIKDVLVDAVKMELAVPDTGDNANNEVIRYIAEVLRVEDEKFTVAAGYDSTLKIFNLSESGLNPAEVAFMLTEKRDLTYINEN
ncbi:UPF0235 protein HY04AAS1_1378-like isoform X2 [Lycorma delicatula]|uniref:UPF0235 protein HY04AAS1_1378-like isoform X2 n=1 Tax=Lycorma delicatula TaxID=130591 RepID=UPI003F51283F